MKAIVNHEYGPPGVLELENVDPPVTRSDEVLVRVHGAAVNPGDWDVMHGTPYVLRLTTGLRRPRNKVLGLAVAGRVEAVGSNVSEFRPGDQVYAGIGKGGFADTLGNSLQNGFCTGSVVGITETLLVTRFACQPKTGQTSHVQAVRIVVEYLNDIPDRMNEPFNMLAIEALTHAWPCLKLK